MKEREWRSIGRRVDQREEEVVEALGIKALVTDLALVVGTVYNLLPIMTLFCGSVSYRG